MKALEQAACQSQQGITQHLPEESATVGAIRELPLQIAALTDFVWSTPVQTVVRTVNIRGTSG